MTDSTIDLSDYANDPHVQVMLDLDLLIAEWTPEVRADVLELLGGMAVVAAARRRPEYGQAAQFLATASRLIRVAGALVDARRATEGSGNDGRP